MASPINAAEEFVDNLEMSEFVQVNYDCNDAYYTALTEDGMIKALGIDDPLMDMIEDFKDHLEEVQHVLEVRMDGELVFSFDPEVDSFIIVPVEQDL